MLQVEESVAPKILTRGLDEDSLPGSAFDALWAKTAEDIKLFYNPVDGSFVSADSICSHRLLHFPMQFETKDRTDPVSSSVLDCELRLL